MSFIQNQKYFPIKANKFFPYTFLLGLFFGYPQIIETSTQQQVERAKPEVVLDRGAANPRPGSQPATVLDTTLRF